MIATSGFLAAFECTKFVFGRVSAPDPAGGAYSAPPDTLANLRGTILLRRRGWESMGGESRGGEAREGKERERNGRGNGPPNANSWKF